MYTLTGRNKTCFLKNSLPVKNHLIGSLESVYFYLTMNDLFTFTGFSGDDPELVGFNGYYDGYSLPIPRNASLGLRFKF